LRKEYPALHRGDFTPLAATRGVLAYLRTSGEQTNLVALNFKGHTANFTPAGEKWRVLLSSNADSESAAAPLSPYEVRVLVSDV